MAHLIEFTPGSAARSAKETGIGLNPMTDHTSDVPVREESVSPRIDLNRMANHISEARVKEEFVRVKQEEKGDYCPITKGVLAPVSDVQMTWNELRNNAAAIGVFNHRTPSMTPIIPRPTVFNGNVNKPAPKPSKRYCCAMCKRKFYYLAKLKVHHRKFHEDHPYCDLPGLQCAECDMTCRSVGGLSSHMRRHARENGQTPR